MKTSFHVNGVTGNSSSTISHIERNHSLKKNDTKQNENEKPKDGIPHIIIFQKNQKYKKQERPKISRTQISKKIATYKSRVKKADEEILALEKINVQHPKLVAKKKTKARNLAKIEELEKEREETAKIRNEKQYDFVDIPFSVTECDPTLLSEADFKRLNQIALSITTTLFNIDEKLIGQVAHLDQTSAHIHISFHIPENKVLSELVNKKGEEKYTYREMQLLFNERVREAFPNLQIDKICETEGENQYLELTQYKAKCKQEKTEMLLRMREKDANDAILDLEEAKNKINQRDQILNFLQNENRNLEFKSRESEKESEAYKNTISDLKTSLEQLHSVLADKTKEVEKFKIDLAAANKKINELSNDDFMLQWIKENEQYQQNADNSLKL